MTALVGKYFIGVHDGSMRSGIVEAAPRRQRNLIKSRFAICGDLGRDVIAVKKGIGSVRVIDQVKAYAPTHLVPADDVRALMGVIIGDRASKGFLSTTSDFAPGIATDRIIQNFIPDRLELINGSMLLTRLEQLASRR